MTLNKKTAQGCYEAPSVQSLDIMSEGVLCESGDVTIKEWERDEDYLDF